EEVLGVEPAAYRQQGWLDVLQVRPKVAGFPEGVVGRVRGQLVPEQVLATEVPCVEVGPRAEAQEEVVPVGRAVLEGGVVRLTNRPGPGRALAGGVIDGVAEEERAVVMPVVPDERIDDWGLWRDRLQGRVGVDCRLRREEAAVRHPVIPDLAVVTADV